MPGAAPRTAAASQFWALVLARKGIVGGNIAGEQSGRVWGSTSFGRWRTLCSSQCLVYPASLSRLNPGQQDACRYHLGYGVGSALGSLKSSSHSTTGSHISSPGAQLSSSGATRPSPLSWVSHYHQRLVRERGKQVVWRGRGGFRGADVDLASGCTSLRRQLEHHCHEWYPRCLQRPYADMPSSPRGMHTSLYKYCRLSKVS